MTVTWADIAIIMVVFYALELLRRVVWGVSNFLADKFLRRKGWDADTEYFPMVDYTPVWCLFTGVDHMPMQRRSTFRRGTV